MIKKMPNIKLNKKMIIIGSIILFVLIIAFTMLKLFVRNDFYFSESKIADDSEEALKDLFQKYEESKSKFYVYGEVGLYDKISMTMNCGDEEETVELSEEATIVNNHCILSIKPSGGYLTVYIVTPDSSVISVNSFDSLILQVNAYKKETRIVLESGIIYNRIAEQKNGSKFSIQIANQIFETEGAQEISAYARTLDGKSMQMYFEQYIINAEKNYEIIGGTGGIAKFQPITGKLNTRNRNETKVVETDKYKDFAYYKGEEYSTILFDEISGYIKDLYTYYDSENNDFKYAQGKLNDNKDLNFIGIAKKGSRIDKEKLNKQMKEYVDYYTNKIKNANNEQEENNNSNSNSNNDAIEDFCKKYYSPTGELQIDHITWCRSDLGFNGNPDELPKGIEAEDFIWCEFWYNGNYIGVGPVYQPCALKLGWDGTYTN